MRFWSGTGLKDQGTLRHRHWCPHRHYPCLMIKRITIVSIRIVVKEVTFACFAHCNSSQFFCDSKLIDMAISFPICHHETLIYLAFAEKVDLHRDNPIVKSATASSAEKKSTLGATRGN